ncbi:hypothetical protein UZ36_00755 [Candidatus Nitromaritima sp. SCGC AAA799-C22]|nr:hypothetical protein UZ36_00755 [Candidatus Nitromaritima sp. SCGC AAA799-C22]
MKMHHLEDEEVKAVMYKVKEAVAEEELDPDKIEEIFKLSKVDPEGFLNCKSNEVQQNQVNFEIDETKGVRFFDPFNFYTQGIYKDMDGWSVWTTDNLKEPWSYD